MSYTYVNGGWLVFIPSALQIVLLSLIIVVVFFIGRATVLKHLIKYHLYDIKSDQLYVLKMDNERLTRANKKLIEDRDLYTKILSGIRYLTHKEG